MGVQDAVAAVRTFAGEGEFRAFAIEFSAPVDEVLYGGGAFLDEGVDGVLVAESVAGVEGVVFV